MLLEYIVGTIIGNISTALVLALVYFNFLLFEDYFRVIIWSILFSQALRGAKERICRVLDDLSHAEDVQRDGLLYTICNQFWPYLMQGQDKKKRIQELILDNGIFIFAMIGAVSIYVRMYSWLSFLQLFIGILTVLAATLYVLDRRIFHYRFFISDEVLVSALLLVGCCIIGVFVLLFLGTESYMEGNRAAMHLTSWIQNNVVNDERTRKLWNEQVHNGKAMIASGLTEIEGQYNTTMWFAPLKALVFSYYDASDDKAGVAVANNVMNATKVAGIIDIPANITWTSMFTLAYSKFNLTSTDVTDWTAKGLEISSMAFGSVFQILFFVITFTVAFISIGIKAFFFVTSLFYLLCTDWDPIKRFASDITSKLPDEPKAQALANPLRQAIEGAFFLPLKISSLHAIVTLVSLSMMANDFVYLGTLITFFISIVPIIPAYLVCIPWVVALWSSTSFFKALLLFAIHYVAFSWIDQVLYQKSLAAINPYVSALSVVFGVYVFGLEGVVFGPLLVWGVQYAYSVGIKGDPYFSDTMKVISELNSRKCSMDITEVNAIEISLKVVHVDRDLPSTGTNARTIRFVVDKRWAYEEMLEQIRQLLRVQIVKRLYDTKDEEIMSAKHIKNNEILLVEVEGQSPQIYRGLSLDEACVKGLQSSIQVIQENSSSSRSSSSSNVASDLEDELAEVSTKSQASEEAEIEPSTNDDNIQIDDMNDKVQSEAKDNKDHQDDYKNGNDETHTIRGNTFEVGYRADGNKMNNAKSSKIDDLDDILRSDESMTKVAPTDQSSETAKKMAKGNAIQKENGGRVSSQVASFPPPISRSPLN